MRRMHAGQSTHFMTHPFTRTFAYICLDLDLHILTELFHAISLNGKGAVIVPPLQLHSSDPFSLSEGNTTTR